MKTAILIRACAALTMAVSLRAQTGDLAAFSNLVQDYNAISFGNADLSFTSQDVEGPVAVGGNLTLGGDTLVTLTQFDTASNPALYVAGTFAIDGNATVQLDNGYAALPGNQGTGTYPYEGNATRYQPAATSGWLEVNSSATYASTDPRSNPIGTWTTTPMGSVQSQLTGVSNDLANYAATGAIAVSGQNLTFTGAASGITVFDLNANLLLQSGGSAYYGSTSNPNDRFTSIAMTIPTNAFYIINLTNAGSDPNPIFGSDVNFNLNGDPTQPSRLLWNLSGSGSVTLGNNGQFFGSVLAPQMTVSNGTNDPMEGQIVAGDLDYQNAELHFAQLAVPIPEPPLVPAALGAAVLAWVLRRRRHTFPNCHNFSAES